MRPSQKHGTSGVSNAAAKPYRLVGGTHDHPRHFSPETSAAFKTSAGRFQDYAPFHRGMIGGLMAARIGFPFEGAADWEKQLAP